MRNALKMLIVPAMFAAAACSQQQPVPDAGLSNDLALASSATPYQPQQVVSPYEQGYTTQQYASQPTRTYSAPVRQPVVYRSAPRSSTSYPSYPAPARQPVRHTARDAAIGAAAGATIGAVTSRDKVKGGLIGAAAGAVLGGIIGHSVDVQH